MQNVLNGNPCEDPDCSYAHTRQELRTSHAAFYKATLCRFHNKRKCLNGEFCRFAHGYDELRSAQSQGEGEAPVEVPKKPRKKGKKGRKQPKSEASTTVPGTTPPIEASQFVTPITSAVTSHVSSFASHESEGRSVTPPPVNWFEVVPAPHDAFQPSREWAGRAGMQALSAPDPSSPDTFQPLQMFPGGELDDDLRQGYIWGSPVSMLMPSPSNLLCSLPAGVLTPSHSLQVFDTPTHHGAVSPVHFPKFPPGAF